MNKAPTTYRRKPDTRESYASAEANTQSGSAGRIPRPGEPGTEKQSFHGSLEDTNSQGYIGAPKTAQGRRTIAMAPELAEILANHRQSLLAAQHPSLTKGWLFAKDDGEHYYSSPLRKPLLKALKRAGILFRFTCHGFRRTYNDLLQRVAKERVVRDILGHRRPEMTAHYSTIRMNEKNEAAHRMFQLIQGGQRSRCTETGTLREDLLVCPQYNAEFPLNSSILQRQAPDGA